MKHTPAQRRTLARLRLQRMKLKRDGKYLPAGAVYRNASRTSVQDTWRRAGWRPVDRKTVAEAA